LGPSGTLRGTVIGAGRALEGAQIRVTGAKTYLVSSDASGQYTMVVPAGTYTVTASTFGHVPETVPGVVVVDGSTTVQDFDLPPEAPYVLSGTVTDGSACGWTLPAEVNIVAAGGPTKTVYTNPTNGTYSALLINNVDYTVTATPLALPGYSPASVTFTVSGSDVVQDFFLSEDGSCTAPGYAMLPFPSGFAENFNGPVFPPPGWTMLTTQGGGTPAEWGNLAACREVANFTNGDGDVACASSRRTGIAPYDTELRSPLFDDPGVASVLDYTANYQHGWDLFDVDLSTDGGSTWTTLLSWSQSQGAWNGWPGKDVQIGLTGQLAPSGNMLRWRYYDPDAHLNNYAQVDDIVAPASCGCAGGAIYYGHVYDAITGAALDGAKVQAADGAAKVFGPVATKTDVSQGPGWYSVWVDDTHAPLTMTASKARYFSDTVSGLTPPPGQVWRRQDFSLGAGLLAATPAALKLRVNVAAPGATNTVASDTFSVENQGTGGETISYRTQEKGGGAFFLSAQTQPPAGQAQPASSRPRPNAAGTVIAALPTGLKELRGIALAPDTYVPDAATLWVADVGWYGTQHLYEFKVAVGAPSMVATGRKVAVGNQIPRGLAYRRNTGTFWTAGPSCISELDPSIPGFTGNLVCAALDFTMAGLAHDPLTDTYLVGRESFAARIGSSGATLETWDRLGTIGSLAYNPATGHLFARDGGQIRVYDAVDPDLPLLRSFHLSAAVSTAGGLSLDCLGRLWVADASTEVVYVADSGETGSSADCVVDVPWLDENPKNGSLAPGDPALVHTVDVRSEYTDPLTMELVKLLPGCYSASIELVNHTPVGATVVPVDMQVSYLDVAATNVFDKAIHSWATYVYNATDSFVAAPLPQGPGIDCGGGNFCPQEPVTRAMMAVWMLYAKEGPAYNPPVASGLVFDDVPGDMFAADFVEELARRGVVVGCGNGNYCPHNPVTRAQMAIYQLRTLEGAGYLPPACVAGFERFADVPASDSFCPWIEELARRGVVVGCGGGNYCPGSPVTKAQMTVFNTKTFDIPRCP